MKDDKVKILAKKWYQKLDFAKEYDRKFEKLLETETGFYETKFEDFDLRANKDEYSKNVIWALYFLEQTSLKYKEKNIPENIMMDTFFNVRFTIMKYTDIFGELSLKGIDTWVNLHLSFKLFTIGRLQYEMRGAESGAEHLGLLKDKPVLAVHIPKGEALTEESCIKSFDLANKFFKKYFPEYKYEYFTCHSWMLDRNLDKFLSPDSNLVKFKNLFVHASDTPLDSAISFCFPHDVNRENIKDFTPKTSLQRKIREHVLAGGVLNYTYGIRKIQTNLTFPNKGP